MSATSPAACGRRPSYVAAVGGGRVPGGFALEEGTGIRCSGTDFVEAVSATPGQGVWPVDDSTGTPLEHRLLAA